MDHREIILQMEERKYDALRRALLARDTDPRAEMQEWLNVCYRELVPQQERELIEKQINEERQPGLSEAGTQPKFNVFRVIERGECHCFQVNDASVDALEIANRLYGYLSRETVGFAEQFEGWTSLTECRFIDQMMRCLCEDERVAGAFHIDLDTGTFSALDPENGWCTYPVRDAAEAARFSMGQDEVAREQCFQQKLAGKRINTDKLVINEPEAEVVRMIFAQYLSGQSKDDIAEYVSTLGMQTREGNTQWGHKAISYILSNERYVGDSLLQKKYTTDTLPFKQMVNRGEKEQYFVPQSHPAIIDRETFDAVAELLGRRTFTMPQRESSPLAMKVFCGICGNSYRRAVCGQKTYWVCRQHYRDKDRCPSGRIPEEEIYAAFLRVYHKLRLHGGPILKQMIADLQSVRERRMLWSLDIVSLNQKIADLSDQDRMLADMNKCGLVDPDIFISQSNELARQLRAAKQKKEQLLADGDDDTLPRTRELLETLETLPEFLPAFDGEIFTDLVERITAEGDGTLRFRLKNGLELTETTERSVR